jgi:proline iminopeptidase
MSTRWIATSLAAVLMTASPSHTATAQRGQPRTGASEARIPVGSASLYTRVIGYGRAVIVLHGGPDFDHGYLLPELDQLADAYRLIYYDQRGRGKSAEHVRPEDVTLASDVDDLDSVRQHFRLDAPVLLGHSWGTVLALEYALRHPTLVSHLVLMNPAPASASQLAVLRKSYLAQLGSDMDRQREIMASTAYKEGDPDAVTARYRIHFKPALRRPADYEKLMARMSAGFHSQGKDGIVKARAVEDRLYRDSWQVPGYDLLPTLRSLRIPTLVIVGEQDFIPTEIATQIAQAIPGATLVTIRDCGHFAYLECGAEVRNALNAFFRRTAAMPRQVPATDEAALRSVIAARDRAWNGVDTAAYARLFTPDADQLSATGRGAEGRDAVVALLVDLRASVYAGASVTNRVLKIRLLRPDVALVDTEYELSGLKATAAQRVADHGRILFVLRKVENRWLIAAIRGIPATGAKP